MTFHTHEKAQEVARRLLSAWEKEGSLQVKDRSRAVRLASDVLYRWFQRHVQAVEEAEKLLQKHARSDVRMREQLFRKYYREALEKLIS